MPIPSLKGIYQQYKADTDLVAEWLAVTAKTHGYAATDTPVAKPAAVGGRPKGKARKAAKNQASKQPKTSTSVGDDGSDSKKPTYLIKIKEFEPLAQFVSKVDQLKVPNYFSIALERVIQGWSLFKTVPGQSSERQKEERVEGLTAIHGSAKELLRSSYIKRSGSGCRFR